MPIVIISIAVVSLLVVQPATLYVSARILRVRAGLKRVCIAQGLLYVLYALWIALTLRLTVRTGEAQVLLGAIPLTLTVLLLRRIFGTTYWRAVGTSVLLFAINLGAGLGLRAVALEAFSIAAGAMRPTLLPGDRIVVDKITPRFRAFRKGDVVTFRPPHVPDQTFIMRVAATAGDRVDIREDVLYVNDAAAGRCSVHSPPPDGLPGMALPAVVPEGKLMMLGDSREWSLDSRYWGFADVDAVVGLAGIIYASRVPPPTYDFPEEDRSEPPGTVRWERIGTVVR